MAASSLNPNSRSISLPPRPHPIYPQLDEQLHRLRSSSLNPAPSTSSSIADRLDSVKSLYDCVDGFLSLPQNQASFAAMANSADGVLDGSLKLLDVCSTSRDALLQIKEHVQGIQSVLRRRSSDELAFIDEISHYVTAIKAVKKVLKKCLDESRALPKGSRVRVRVRVPGGVHMITVLREVEGVTCEAFQSLLCYVVGLNVKSRRGSWGLVSRILLTMTCEEGFRRNEFDDVDVVLGLGLGQRKRSDCDVEGLRRRMVELESVIQDFDELVEGLFRRLVKTRASLLNILSQ